MNEEKIYKYPIALTQQFRMCGNPFRIDTYKGCSYGCKYCFANTNGFTSKNNFMISDFDKVTKLFYQAFETDKEYKSLNVELLRHRVPLHLGGMSDPFQIAEAKYGLTYKLLELTKRYKYPMMISTKASSLPQSYWDILDKNYHALQISLCGIHEEFIRNIEKNTPTPMQRILFTKALKSKWGGWVSIRLQPLINLEEAIEVVKATSHIVDYITVEHLKISTDDSEHRKFWFNLSGHDVADYYRAGKNYELETKYKLNNINRLKEISKCKIGCGDNDLHEHSDSYNCCGIDTINENFNNWLKYNSMYIGMTQDRTSWYPKSNCSSCFNSDCRIKGYGYKDYVDDFIKRPLRKQKIHIKI